MPPALASARRSNRLSQLISQRAVREARKVRGRGTVAISAVVVAHQLTQARTSQTAVAEILAEQGIAPTVDAVLQLAAFTTDAPTLDRMLAQIVTDLQFDRLVESLVTDAARAAESVAVATRPGISHTRWVNLPCCSRCAILAGRVYRWSSGFKRHPGCDCSMIPTTVGSQYAQDPEELVRRGQVTGLSKDDLRALNDGANLGKVVNIRRRAAGLLEAGHALTRGGRPTPAGIYRIASDREQAVELLGRYGYIL